MRLANLSKISLESHSIRLMADLLREVNLDPEKAASESFISMEVLEDSHATILASQELAFQRAFYRQTSSRPDLWVELGHRYRLLTHGHLSYVMAMSTAGNLRQMFEICTVFDDLHYTIADTQLIESQGQLIGFQSSASEAPADLKQFTMIRDLASCSGIFQDLWGNDFPFRSIESDVHSSYLKLLQPLFKNTPVICGDLNNNNGSRWYWEDGADIHPLSQSNPLLHQYFRDDCECILDSCHLSSRLSVILKSLLLEEGLETSIRKTAKRLNLSVRTLQRRLADEGWTYRDLVADARFDIACNDLKKTDKSVEVIAWDVGYQDVTSFSRAFRNKVGMSPGAFRHK